MANSWGLCGPDFLRFLWAVADYAARTKSYLQLHDLPIPEGVNALDMEHSRAVMACKRLRNRLYHDYILRMHQANILEAATAGLFGKSFAHRESVSCRIIQDHQIVMAQPAG